MGRGRVELVRVLAAAAATALLLSACGSTTATGTSEGGSGATGSPSPIRVTPVAAPVSTHITGPVPVSCHLRRAANGAPLPDPSCTPGVVFVTVHQDDLATTVCSRGYARSVRPPDEEVNATRRALMRAYHLTRHSRHYELDHLVPVELGGSNDVRNLWPEQDEPIAQARNSKDLVERALGRAVCAHRVGLAAAQGAIAADWTTALSRLHLPPVMAGRTA